MPRLFSALQIPSTLSTRLGELKGRLGSARWIEPQDYHITLRFFGDVDRHTANDIAEGLGDIDAQSFELEIERLDVFGGNKPRSLFVAIKSSAPLKTLQKKNERIARQAGLAPEKRKFIPHITLARVSGVSAFTLADYLASHRLVPGQNFAVERVERFVLMTSKDSVGGGPYRVEEEYHLKD